MSLNIGSVPTLDDLSNMFNSYHSSGRAAVLKSQTPNPQVPKSVLAKPIQIPKSQPSFSLGHLVSRATNDVVGAVKGLAAPPSTPTGIPFLAQPQIPKPQITKPQTPGLSLTNIKSLPKPVAPITGPTKPGVIDNLFHNLVAAPVTSSIQAAKTLVSPETNLAKLAAAKISNNQQAATNARAALSNSLIHSILGSGIQTAALVLGGGEAKAAEDVGKGVLAKAAASSAKLAPVGAAFGGGQAIASGQKPADIAKSAAAGATFTGALGGFGSLAKSAITHPPIERPLPSPAEPANPTPTPVETQPVPVQVSAPNNLINHEISVEGGHPTTMPAAPEIPTVSRPQLTLPARTEAGSVDLSGLQNMLDKHAKVSQATGDISKDFATTQNKNVLNEQQVADALNKRTVPSTADRQTLLDYRDAKAAGLTPAPLPDHLQTADASATTYAKAQIERDAAAARASGNEVKAQTIESRDPETYTHREAIGKGSNLELTMRGDKSNPSSVGLIGRRASSSNSRNMMNATDEMGNRRTVNIDKGRVTAIDKGGAVQEDLGNLNLKTNADSMQKELTPVNNQLANLNREKNIITSSKGRTAVSTQRLANIDKTTQDLVRQQNAIMNKYDANELENKSFTGKDGKKYTLGQATTSEITKNTGQKYYVDPELTNALSYSDSQKALNNVHFLENTKSILEDKQLAFKPGETAPKNFKTTSNPYFPGYKLEPKLAEQLDDITGRTKRSVTGEVLDDINHVLRQTIIYLPIKHDFNEGAGYFIDRGMDKWLSPPAYARMASSLRIGAKAIATHDQFYKDILHTDFSLMGGGDTSMGKVIKSQLSDTLDNRAKIMEFARATKLNPIKAYKALQKVSVYDTQNILNAARIAERMKPTLFGLKKGMSFEDAVAATKRYNFQYKVPSRVGGKLLPGKLGRAAAEGLGSNKLYFGAYTYDKFRIGSNILKDTVNPKTLIKKPSANAEAANKLAATVFIASIVWPLVDKGLRAVTGDPNAHTTAPGVSSVAEMAQKVIQKKESPAAAAGSQLSIAAPITIGTQEYSGINSFTGKRFRDPNAPEGTKVKQDLSFLGSQIPFMQKATTSKNATVNKGLSTFLSLAGASLPKNTPASNKLQSLKFDSLPIITAQAKAQGAKGNLPAAIKTINQYDAEVLKAAIADRKAKGQSVLSNQQLVQQLKKGGFYYQPKPATIKSWAAGKKVVKGAFVP